MRPIVEDSINQSVILRVIDSTDGTPETGVAYDTVGVDLWYRREGGLEVSITEASLAAVNTAHTDGGFIHISDGYCRLDLPDAAIATGVDGVMVGGIFTDMIVIGCYVPIIVADIYGEPIVDAEDSVCDALLTGAAHNINTSLGKRIRELETFVIESGTAQAGAATTITLAAAVDVADNLFNRNLIVLTDNTGKGQTRSIAGYDNATKICLVDYEWGVNPDNTTAYQIIPSNTPLVVDHGLAQGGTSTTITLHTLASATNDLYKNSLIVIVGGTGKGQTRLITAYNGTTKVVTIGSPVWAITPDATSIYGVVPYGVSCVSNLSTDALSLMNSALLDSTIEGTLTIQQALMIFLGALVGKSDGAQTTLQHFRNTLDTKNRITASVDSSGNRTSITLDLT